MTPARPVLARVARGLLVAAALAGAARAKDLPNLALLIDRPSKTVDRAVAAVQAMPDVRVHLFVLSKGTREVDRIVAYLREFPFDGAVALGAAAHEFFRAHDFDIPYAATLVVDAAADDAIVPFEPAASEWAALIDDAMPPERRSGKGATLGTIVEAGELPPLVEGLAAELKRRGRSLRVEVASPGTPVTQVLRTLLPRVRGFFFHRQKVLTSIHKHLTEECHRQALPVFSFTPILVNRAGAVMSLHVEYERAALRAAEKVLGRPGKGKATSLKVNRARARDLGLRVPEDAGAP